MAYGVNRLGVVVGAYQKPDGTWHGFMLSGGDFSSFDFPGAQDTVALGINDSDQIVGWYDTGQGFLTFGFFTDGEVFTSIQYSDKLITEAHAINNAGEIVGQAGDTQNQLAFELSDGDFTTVRPPDGKTNYYGWATGINNLEEVVGHVVLYGDNKEGFRYKRPGRYQYILYPGAASTEVDGLNNLRILVGYYAYNNSAWYGFATINGRFLSLTYPGATYTVCYGINARGQIVGEAVVGSKQHGFVTNAITDADFH